MKERLLRMWRSAAAWSLVNLAVRVLSAALIIPLTATHVPSDELAFWYVFTSILTLVAVLDIGLTATIGRTLAASPDFHQRLERGDFSPDTLRLLGVMRLFYLALGGLTFVALSVVGGWWIWIRSAGHDEAGTVRLAWLLLCPSFALAVIANFGRGLLFAINRVDLFNILATLGTVSQLVIIVGGLLNQFSIYALVLSNVALFLFHAFTLVLAFKTAPSLLPAISRGVFDWDTARSLLKVASGTFFNTLSSFLVLSANTLIASRFLSLAETASYGMTLQCSFLASQASSVWIEAKYPVFAQMHREDPAALHKLLIRRLRLFLVSYVGCVIGLVFFGNLLLKDIGASTFLLPASQILVLCTFHCLYSHQVHFEVLGLCLGRNPFTKFYLMTAAATLGLTLAATPVFKIWALLLVPMAAQLVFNNWYVVLKVLQMINLSPRQYLRGLLGIAQPSKIPASNR